MQMSLFEPEDLRQKKAELIKHTAAIHIKATELSLVDRKIINILLKNAYDTIDTAKYHTIRMAELKELIGWKSKNYAKLKGSLRRLVDTKIEWNILKKDKKNEWAISSLLASASIAGGKCTYDYSYHLKTLLKNPNIYSKINLLTQNNFKSKYSLILWEYLSNFIATSNEETVSTDWISIKDYRNLMGIEDGQYSTLKELSFNLIKAPVKDINKLTEIAVEAKYKKNSATITDIRFIIKNQEQKPEIKTVEALQDKVEDSTEIIKTKLLNFCKLSPASVDKILAEYSQEQLIANIKYIEAENKKGLVKSLAAYSFKAIQNDFRLEEEPIIKSQVAELPKKPKIQIENDHPFWKQAGTILKTEFGEESYTKWITQLNFVSLNNGKLHLVTTGENGKFQRDWIKREYQPTILSLLENSGVSSIIIAYLEND